ncbi:OmpP1/FadL family transporter [Pseudovibrio brasiliensis]|uniref:Outer membrane protein transport protein n=1 Tax=Pseudovibrio brasiliensis TaxID=1898042 RepID=A0ABX8AM36_9HYPH|nr:outer membrane protein transport protein [Pseudovibrio brasiliensis]QUS54970.1 outer membrane protein transport protein [Pseudovibrio brasiliensis]
MRVLKNAGRGLAAGCFVLAGSGSALAGAWDTLGIGSSELLFAPEKFVVEGSVTYVDRNVDYDNTAASFVIPGVPPTVVNPGGPATSRATPNIWNYQGALKFGITDNADCMARINNPLSIEEEMDPDWRGRFSGYETQARTLAFDATCAYRFQVGEGRYFRAIAGVKAQDLSYYSKGAHPLAGTAEVDLKADGLDYGWRVGVAYEVPAYALRASLIYDSQIETDLSGDTIVGGSKAFDSTASLTLPQSVELNVQSGIAPGWLVSAGVKWVDWSVIDVLSVDSFHPVSGAAEGETVHRKLNFKDGWTVKAGIGHALNEKVSLGSSLQWDRGVGGSYSDTYTFGFGGSYAANKNVKFTVGTAAIYKTAGSGDATNFASGTVNEYDYDASWAYAVNTKIRLSF